MNIAAAIIFVLAIYAIIKHLYKKRWNHNLSVDVSFSQNEAIEGDDITLVETITNRKLLPLPILMIKFNTARCLRYKDKGMSENSEELFDDGSNSTVTDFVYRNDIVSVSAYQKKVRTLHLKCVTRGYCSITNIYTVCSDFFLGSKITESKNCFTDIYVYPKFVDSQIFNINFNSLMGEVLTKRYINEDPFEFKGIRDYQSFDSLKSVNWKASARSMELKVNQTATTASWQVTVMLNLDSISGLRDEELDENAIRLAATFVARFSDMGIPVSFITNAHDNYNGQAISINHGCGNDHVKNILVALARLGIYKHEPDDFAPLLSQSLDMTYEHNWFFIISSTTSERIANALKDRTKNVKYIIPCRPDSDIKPEGEIGACAKKWIIEY